MNKKCDICKGREENKEDPFVKIFRETINTYQPTNKDPFFSKVVMRTKKVWVCPICYLTKIKGRKLKK